MQLHILGGRIGERSGHEAGRHLLDGLYRSVTGEAMPQILAAPGEKPRFSEGPWYFSISHTDRHVFCALCSRPVGIDGEELSRSLPEKLAGRILSPGEMAEFSRAEDKNRALLTFWVLKEAAAKCTGRGIQYPENKTNFSLADSRVRELDGCLVAVITEEDYAL